MSTIKLGATFSLLLGAFTNVAWSQTQHASAGTPKPTTPARAGLTVDQPTRSQAPEPRLKGQLDRTYVLADGEDLKCFKSPARYIRVEYDRAALHARGILNPHNEDSDAYFRWRDRTRKWFLTYGAPRGNELRSALLPILGIQEQEAEGDVELPRTPIRADFIIRDGVAAEKLVPQLAAVFRKDFGLPIRLTLRTEPRKVVVCGGRYQYKPVNAHDGAGVARPELDRIEVYARKLGDAADLSHGLIVSGADLARFLSDLAKHTGVRFVNEVEGPPRGWFSWHISDYTYPMPISEEDLDLTLEHLVAQTGLSFRKEVRRVRVLRVARAD